jgi:hypothetical protein
LKKKKKKEREKNQTMILLFLNTAIEFSNHYKFSSFDEDKNEERE